MKLTSVCVVALLLTTACGEEAADPAEDGATMAAPDASGDAPDTTGGSFDAPTPDVAACTGVCYRSLPPEAYPEAENPPRLALHCGERGVGPGLCPPGSRCGDVTTLADGRRLPLCEGEGGIAELALDVPLDASASLEDDLAELVELRLVLGGEPLPARVAGGDRWGSRLTITHRESLTQWSAPLPSEPDETIELGLRPGVHDVVVFLRRADFTAPVPDAVFRGELEVVTGGGAVVELGAGPLTISLRYADSPLTSAESAAVRLTLLGSGGRRIDYQMNGGERGRAALVLPSGEWGFTVTVNGLRSLFPAIPLDPAVALAVPGDDSVTLDLETIWVAGSLRLNGEPAGGRLLFAHGGLTQPAQLVDREVVGNFRTLLWPRQPYHIYYEGAQGEVWLVRTAWLPDEEPLDLALETTSFTVAVALPDAPAGSFSATLGVVDRAGPAGAIAWRQATRLEGSTAFFDLTWAPDAVLDFWLQTWGTGLPQGMVRLAGGVTPGDRTFEPEIGELYIDIEILEPDGSRAELNSASLELLGAGPGAGGSRTYLSLSSATLPAELPVWPGSYELGLWPGWSDWGLANLRYPMGFLEVGQTTAVELVLETRRVSGEVTLAGERLGAPAPNFGQRGSVRLQTPWGAPWIPLAFSGDATWQTVLGPAYYDVAVYCTTVECVEKGLSVQPVPLYEAVWMWPAAE